jgi:hypothetical protein
VTYMGGEVEGRRWGGWEEALGCEEEEREE